MPKLDDASWHYGDDEFPEGVPEENGATHIGMYAAWAIHAGMWGDFLGKPAALAVEEVRARRMSGRAFVLGYCDGKLLSEMLTPEGAAFALSYYPKQFMRDFQRTLTTGLASDYHVEDSWSNYDRLADRMNARLSSSKTKPWWRFW